MTTSSVAGALGLVHAPRSNNPVSNNSVSNNSVSNNSVSSSEVGAARPDSSSIPLSAAAFKDLVVDTRPSLVADEVTVVFGSTAGGRRHPGPTWISVTSPWGYGRCMRRNDGSFESSAYRSSDGEQVHAAQGATATRQDFENLIAAVDQAPGRGED